MLEPPHQIWRDLIKGSPYLKYEPGVHNVLGRRTPVRPLAKAIGDDRRELLDETNNGIANDGHLVSERSKAKVVYGNLPDLDGRLVWNQTNLGLDLGQGGFYFEISPDQAPLTQDVPEFRSGMQDAGNFRVKGR